MSSKFQQNKKGSKRNWCGGTFKNTWTCGKPLNRRLKSLRKRYGKCPVIVTQGMNFVQDWDNLLCMIKEHGWENTSMIWTKFGLPRSEMEVLRLCSGQEKQDARVEVSVRPQSSRGVIMMFLVLFWSFSCVWQTRVAPWSDPGHAQVCGTESA